MKSPAGFAQTHPSVAIAAKSAASWRQFIKTLGLDKPAKRSKPPKILPDYLRRADHA